MDLRIEQLKAITRRHFFQRSGTGIGGMALAALANERLFAADGACSDGSRPSAGSEATTFCG